MNRHSIGSAPNYTTPALIMMGVNLFWMFCVLWALLGLLPVVLVALGLNHAITILDRFKARQ